MIALALVAVVAVLLAAGLVFRWQSHLMARERIGQLTNDHQEALKAFGQKLEALADTFDMAFRHVGVRVEALEAKLGETAAQKALRESYARKGK